MLIPNIFVRKAFIVMSSPFGSWQKFHHTFFILASLNTCCGYLHYIYNYSRSHVTAIGPTHFPNNLIWVMYVIPAILSLDVHPPDPAAFRYPLRKKWSFPDRVVGKAIPYAHQVLKKAKIIHLDSELCMIACSHVLVLGGSSSIDLRNPSYHIGE